MVGVSLFIEVIAYVVGFFDIFEPSAHYLICATRTSLGKFATPIQLTTYNLITFAPVVVYCIVFYKIRSEYRIALSSSSASSNLLEIKKRMHNKVLVLTLII